jgi:glycosyltransferase involved in cell wall biosynthesis
MRMVHVITRNIAGGAERNLWHHAAWQVGQGHDVSVVVGRESGRAESAGIPMYVLPRLQRSISPFNDVAALTALRALLARLDAEVVHTHESKAGAVGRVAAASLRLCVVHTVHMPSFGPGYGATSSRLHRTAERRLARLTDVLVHVGDDVQRLYESAGIAAHRPSIVVPSPIDVDGYAELRHAPASAVRTIRRRLSLETDTPIALAVGALEPRKRHDLLLRELAPLLRDGRLALVIVGHGSREAALREFADALGVRDRVRISGFSPDPRPYFAAAEVLVHASTMEGVPQVVIQALAAGLPVVATDAVGAREVQHESLALVASSGAGLGLATEQAILRPCVPIDVSRLGQWRYPSVEARLENLQELIETAILSRRARSRLVSLRAT